MSDQISIGSVFMERSLTFCAGFATRWPLCSALLCDYRSLPQSGRSSQSKKNTAAGPRFFFELRNRYWFLRKGADRAESATCSDSRALTAFNSSRVEPPRKVRLVPAAIQPSAMPCAASRRVSCGTTH